MGPLVNASSRQNIHAMVPVRVIRPTALWVHRAAAVAWSMVRMLITPAGMPDCSSSRQNIHAMVERAIADGAVLETGGVLPEGPGHFYPPTLLSACRQDMEIIQEEGAGLDIL